MAGRKALVTGGTLRIGRGITLALARQGAKLLIHCNRSRLEADKLARQITAAGGEAEILQADLAGLADPEQVEQLITRTNEAGPDILINNAAIFPKDSFRDFTPDGLDQSVRVNALAPALLSRAFARQTKRGDVINLLDCRIGDYDAGHLSYHLSKQMLFSLTRIMALDLAPGIRVNAVAPGLVLAPAGEEYSDELRLELAKSNPLKRWGTIEEVSRAVLFLLENPFITGQVIYVDGGRHLRVGAYG